MPPKRRQGRPSKTLHVEDGEKKRPRDTPTGDDVERDVRPRRSGRIAAKQTQERVVSPASVKRVRKKSAQVKRPRKSAQPPPEDELPEVIDLQQAVTEGEKEKEKATLILDDDDEDSGDSESEGESAEEGLTVTSRAVLKTSLGDPAPGSTKYVGAHVSIGSGLHKVPREAAQLGCRSFAIFVKSQRTWAAKPLDAKVIRGFKEACTVHGYPPHLILPHSAYLINLASPDAELRSKSRAGLILEMQRCAQLGLTRLNMHPGTTKGKISHEEGIALIAEGINEAIAAPGTGRVCVVLENTAHGGNCIGRSFEDLAAIIARVEDKARVGVCLDTCHAFAGGYDLRTAAQFDAVMAELDRVVGLQYLMGFHINDSKGAFASGTDRHAVMGQGLIGLNSFRALMNDDRFSNLPLIMETTEPLVAQMRLVQSLERR